MEQKGALTATQAKAVLAEMLESGGDPASIAAYEGVRGPRRRTRSASSSRRSIEPPIQPSGNAICARRRQDLAGSSSGSKVSANGTSEPSKASRQER